MVLIFSKNETYYDNLLNNEKANQVNNNDISNINEITNLLVVLATSVRFKRD